MLLSIFTHALTILLTSKRLGQFENKMLILEIIVSEARALDITLKNSCIYNQDIPVNTIVVINDNNNEAISVAASHKCFFFK